MSKHSITSDLLIQTGLLKVRQYLLKIPLLKRGAQPVEVSVENGFSYVKSNKEYFEKRKKLKYSTPDNS